jgi:DNA mismatch repair protein MutS2
MSGPEPGSLFASPEGRRAGRLLEFAAVLELVAGQCALGRAADLLRGEEPVDDTDWLRRQWLWFEELRRFSETGGEIELGSCADLHQLIGDERSDSGPLGGEELAAIAGAATTLAEMLRSVHAAADRLPLTGKHLRGVVDPRPLADRLHAALEPSGQVRDSASPALGRLRRDQAAAESRVRDVARREMQRAREAGHSSGEELVLRGDRLCVPVRSGSRADVGGIIHDRSSTGHTLFIEPSRVVEAGNASVEARLAVLEEERRILIDLNREVASRAPELVDLFDRAVVLDAMRARVRFAKLESAWSPVRPEDGQTLRLTAFRHPVLARSLAAAGRADELVPLDLELDDARLLLISGPNAGGKTVTLKSVGLAALLSQAVIPVPASEAPVLPIFDAVLIDVGDEQSITDALSSFSAHLMHLSAVLDDAGARSMVLLDEIGGGTDPQEGVALARSLLEDLAARGCRVLATTHYGQLKALVEEDDRFRHGSMAFDPEQLRPEFELQLDLPGSSHALAIARRLGLPGPVLRRAEDLLGDERLLLDDLLRALQEERNAVRGLREGLQGEVDAARLARQHYDRLARELKQKRRDRLHEAEREAEGIVRNARKRVETLLRRIREAGGSEEAVEAAREARDEIEERAERLAERVQRRRPAEPVRRAARIVEGEIVRHGGLGKVGRIVSVRGDRVTLEIGEARVVADPEQLFAPDAEEVAAVQAPRQGSIRTQLVDSAATASTRVDVRGMDAEEAWMAVDKALDRCLVTGMAELEIVHGKGTGRLGRVLAQRLGGDPRVRASGIGGEGRFDEGVTLVQL